MYEKIFDHAFAVLIKKKALTASDFVALVLTIHLSVAVERLWNTLLSRVAHPLIIPETTFAIDHLVEDWRTFPEVVFTKVHRTLHC